MRWSVLWIGVVLTVTGTAGCHRPYFNTETDYTYYNKVSSDYGQHDYDEDIGRLTTAPPRTVRDPGKDTPWELTLEESKRIALENNKQIAFLRYQPGEAGTEIDAQLAAFDANFQMGGLWQLTDTQVANNIQVFGTGANALRQNLFNGVANSGGTFNALPGAELFALNKRNVTGGQTSISYGVNYTNSFPANQFLALNPQWNNFVNISIEQPFLEGGGVEFNRAPILIARARFEQSIKDFEIQVRTLLRDVESEYWQLYFTYQDVYSREVGMKAALATWQKEIAFFDVGKGKLPDVAQAREQFEFFRAQFLQAQSRLLVSEGNLRILMGLPASDGRQIVPKNDPVLVEYQPDWQLSVGEAMQLRPELASQRMRIRAAELELLRARNGLLPELTGFASYSLTGLDGQFDQAVDRLTDNKFANWALGFRVTRPIGERAAHAGSRQAQLTLGRERATLRNLEQGVLHELRDSYQNLIAAYDLIKIQKERRQAAAQQLKAREEFYNVGQTTLDLLLQAQQLFSDALRDEGQAVAQYNQTLTRWEFAKGTILRNDNVMLLEDGVSLMSERQSTLRRTQLDNSLLIPIHPGTAVHVDEMPPQDTSLPLYREVGNFPAASGLTTPALKPQAPPVQGGGAEQTPRESRQPNENLAPPTPRLIPAPQVPGNGAPPANSTDPAAKTYMIPPAPRVFDLPPSKLPLPEPIRPPLTLELSPSRPITR